MQDKRYLYHYKPLSTLDHFSQLQNYMNQKIWFTPFGEFNDPFEACLNHKDPSAEEILNDPKIFNEKLKAIQEATKDPGLTAEMFKSQLKEPELIKCLGKIAPYKDKSPKLANDAKEMSAVCLTKTYS